MPSNPSPPQQDDDDAFSPSVSSRPSSVHLSASTGGETRRLAAARESDFSVAPAAASPPHVYDVARFSTKSSPDTQEKDAAHDAVMMEWRRTAILTPFHVGLVVVMAVLVLASVLTPFYVWNDAVETLNARREAQFKAAVEAHIQGLEEAFSGIQSRTAQYVAFLQRLRSLESFRAFAASDDEVGASRLWLPRVLHADRSAYEAAVTADYRAFFNDSSYTTSMVDYTYPNGSLVLVPSPAAAEYFPLTYIGGSVSVSRPLIGRNMLSEPTRSRAIEASRNTGQLSLSARILVDTGSGFRAASFLARAVYDATNASHLLGVFAAGFRPASTISSAVNVIDPASLHLRAFDSTGDTPDETGCLRPLLFDGVRHRDTGEWTMAIIPESYCPSDPTAFIEDDSIWASVALGDRQWLFIFNRGPMFDDDKAEVSTRLVVLSSVIGSLTVIFIAGVLSRGWWLMGSLRESQANEKQATQRSKAFLSFVTHELRNPLFALMGTAGELASLADSELGPPGSRELISSVELSAERMSTIINDVLNVRKLEEGKLELDNSPTSMSVVARELFAMFSPRAIASGIKLSARVSRNVPRTVVADAGRIVQVMSNFLSNAIKFTPAGGQVRLLVHAEDAPHWFTEEKAAEATSGQTWRSPRVSPLPLATPKFLRLSVQDNGEGISPSEMRRLFQPYSQASAKTASAHGGTGLGLSICKQLVECMGGEIRVESRKGRGSTFSALLPMERVHQHRRNESQLDTAQRSSQLDIFVEHVIEEGDAQNTSSAADQTDSHNTPASARFASSDLDENSPDLALVDGMQLPPSTSRQPLMSIDGERVLIVDDQLINRRILANLFRRFIPGVTVDLGCDGTEAIDAVRNANGEYLLVLLDVTMPVMDGREAVAEIRRLGFDLPVVAVTGMDEQSEHDRNTQAGFTETVVKPLRSATLVGLVSKYARLKGVHV